MRLLSLIIIIILTALAGCAPAPTEKAVTDDNGFRLTQIIEKDGIKVYRFYDCGHYRYFVDARGKTISSTTHTKTQHHVTKNGTRTTTTTTTNPDEIDTIDNETGAIEGE